MGLQQDNPKTLSSQFQREHNGNPKSLCSPTHAPQDPSAVPGMRGWGLTQCDLQVESPLVSLSPIGLPSKVLPCALEP